MGGTNLRIAAITTEGQLLEKITLGVKVAMGRDYVIGEMCDAVKRLSEQYRATGRRAAWARECPSTMTPPSLLSARNGWALAATFTIWQCSRWARESAARSS